MRTGRVEANLTRLLDDEPQIPCLSELVVEKQVAGERAEAPAGAGPEFEVEVARLREALASARDESQLPATAEVWPLLHDFVVRVRLAKP